MIIEWISLFLISLGTVVMFTASLALLRFDNVYLRLHASGKASTGGALTLLLGLLLRMGINRFFGKILILIILIVFTGPILSHAIARAAHLKSGESVEIPFEDYEMRGKEEKFMAGEKDDDETEDEEKEEEVVKGDN